jgi:hypothetical protein
MAKAYKDPTADMAIGYLTRKEKHKKYLFRRAIEMLASICGFKIRVTFIRKN